MEFTGLTGSPWMWLGGITIMKLKERYSKQLGKKFSLLKYHDAVTRQGDMPLTVFEKYMDEWAASVR
jgi:uncharacterized protein (DUF885 family)